MRNMRMLNEKSEMRNSLHNLENEMKAINKITAMLGRRKVLVVNIDNIKESQDLIGRQGYTPTAIVKSPTAIVKSPTAIVKSPNGHRLTEVVVRNDLMNDVLAIQLTSYEDELRVLDDKLNSISLLMGDES